MDFLFLLCGLFLFDHFETNLLILTFLTFFISALSQSVGRSLVVAIAVIALWFTSSITKAMSSIILTLFFFLPGPFVCRGNPFGLPGLPHGSAGEGNSWNWKKSHVVNREDREGNQTSMEYAATLKCVLDTLPIGAVAVSTEGYVFFVNARVGKILEANPKTLTNVNIFTKDGSLQGIGEKMAKAIKERQELKREYIEVEWNGQHKRFRLDSSLERAPGKGLGNPLSDSGSPQKP